MANVAERELILGFPLDYTQHCMPKQQRVGSAYEDTPKTLLGNSWSVPVVTCLLKELFSRLGLMEAISVQEVVNRLTPGQGVNLQSVLQRVPLRRMTAANDPNECLAARMAGLWCQSKVKIFCSKVQVKSFLRLKD